MDVRLSNILNSAEKLIKDKDFSSKTPISSGGKSTSPIGEVQDKAEFSNLLTGKFQTIQSKLSELQSSLSREQMRLSYLNEEKTKEPADLIHVLFGKEPLFPEFQSSQDVDLGKLKKSSEENLARLEKEIRYKEVENENVIALGTQNGSGFSELLKGIESVTWKPMNEKNVQKLIES